jgi:hypothetical protein
MDQFHYMEAKCNFQPPSAKIPNSVFNADHICRVFTGMSSLHQKRILDHPFNIDRNLA